MSNCIFCKIVNKEAESNIVYEDETVVVFRDLYPEAPEHVLIIPKKHIDSVMKLEASDKELIAHILVEVVQKVADKLNIAQSGFRVVVNTGEEGGQTVNHLHFHILGGRSMTWPPG